MRVLIIDDDRAHGETLSDLLNTRGHEAYFAPDLDEAEWFLNLFRFRLALIDCDMPKTTGHDVAVELFKRDPDVQTVLMSARELNRELSAQKAFPFVPKPIGIELLLKLIEQLSTGTSLIRRLSFPLQLYGDIEVIGEESKEKPASPQDADVPDSQSTEDDDGTPGEEDRRDA